VLSEEGIALGQQFREPIDRRISEVECLGRLSMGRIVHALQRVMTNNDWVQVKDPNQLYEAIDQAEAEAVHNAPAHKVSHPERKS
jgi:hypothetical protein